MDSIKVLAGEKDWAVDHANCIQWMYSLPAKSVDLFMFSPPYEDCRTYLEDDEDLGIAMKTEEWVSWMQGVFHAALRVCKGLVACVCEGKTEDFSYSCGPALLMADLRRSGVFLRKPPIFHRVGIPGSGGPDWLRNDWEWIICATSGGRLPWSDNASCGEPPKWKPGGKPSHRMTNGRRVSKTHTKTMKDDSMRTQGYNPPELANPGNVIKCDVGGGRIGHPLAHENEAPYPEELVEFFVRSFCPPNGIVADCFSGSGTTGAVSVRLLRKFIGCDLRNSQVELSKKRISDETPMLLGGF